MMILAILLIITQSPDSVIEYNHTMQRGSTLSEAIEMSGLGKDSYVKLITLLEDSVDVRKCYPGDKINIKRSGNKIVEFSFEGKYLTYSVDSLYRFKREKEKLLLTLIHGYIDGGFLWEAIVSNGGSPNLVYRFTDEIFIWDIDFNVETRTGDEFSILVYKRYIGERFLGFGNILYASYKQVRRELRAYYYTPEGKRPDYYNLEGKSLQRVFLRAPLSYTRISSRFSKSRLHPILRIRRPHLGVDYAAPIGTPVKTIGDGKVILRKWNGGYGNQVVIQHGSRYKSYYGHLSRFVSRVKKGSYVKQGDIIGYVGSTGLSTGPHLDFRIKRDGRWIDPLKLDPPSRKDPISQEEMESFKEYKEHIFSLQRQLETCRNLSHMLGIRNSLIKSEVKQP